jgi:hypothetical protein
MDRWPPLDRSRSDPLAAVGSHGHTGGSGITSHLHLSLATGSMSPALSRAASSSLSPAALQMVADSDNARTSAKEANAFQHKASSRATSTSNATHGSNRSSAINNSGRLSSYDYDDDDNAPPAVRLARIAYKPSTWRDELGSLLAIALPILIAYFLETIPGSISLIFIGHLNIKEYIDAAALATMYQNVTSLAVGFGLATALETLCSVAAGHGDKMMIGIYLQRGILIIGLAMLPMIALAWYAADVLIILGQPPHIAELAGQFSRWLLPGLPFIFLFDLIRKALQAQSSVMPIIFIGISIHLHAGCRGTSLALMVYV